MGLPNGSPLTLGELFAGIGGFGVAAELAGGYRTTWASEIDPFCRAWWAARRPEVTLYGDVRELHDLPYVDVMCGGFPCQDLSTANPNGKGLKGERSGLWSEYARLVRECRPRWVVIEEQPRTS